MIGKIWNFLFLFFVILLVISIVVMAERVLTDKNPIISYRIENSKSPYKDDASLKVNDTKDDKKDYSDGTDKTAAVKSPISKDKKKSGGSSGTKDHDQKPENELSEEEIFDLWTETLLENGLSEEFINNSINVQEYKMSQINNDIYLKIYLTYIIDWANVSIVYPVMINSIEQQPKITGNAIFSTSGKDAIKKDIIKNIGIFKKRNIITKEEYLKIVKDECFNFINTSLIKPEFSLNDNYVIADYFGYFPGEENKCALSTVNLEDKESFCRPQACIKAQILS